MQLPFDSDGELMGYWVDRWLYHRRLHGASGHELTRDARRLAHAVLEHAESDVTLQAFLAFVSGKLDD